MIEGFLTPTETSIIVDNNNNSKIRVQYGFTSPNILLSLVDQSGDDETGDLFVVYRDEKITVVINDNGEVLITSYDDDEANHYSVDVDGNLIYTF